jgi:hypothetical protein
MMQLKQYPLLNNSYITGKNILKDGKTEKQWDGFCNGIMEYNKYEKHIQVFDFNTMKWLNLATFSGTILLISGEKYTYENGKKISTEKSEALPNQAEMAKDAFASAVTKKPPETIVQFSGDGYKCVYDGYWRVCFRYGEFMGMVIKDANSTY